MTTEREGVHHICIHQHVTVMDGEVYPHGADEIKEKLTYILSGLIDMLVPNIMHKHILVCGDEEAKRMFARKLEDRLKRPVGQEVTDKVRRVIRMEE